MALIKCRNCGAEISDRAPDCIHCGAMIIKGPSNDCRSEQERALQQNLSKIKKEKHDLETENARYKTAAVTAENQLVSEQSKKAKLETEKEFLVQRNQDLQQTISSIEKDRQSLANENARYKSAVTEVNNRLSDEQRKKTRLERENEALQQRNLELERQAKESIKKAKALEAEKEIAQKAKTAKAASKKVTVKIGGILRLLLVVFFALGALVSLLSSKFALALWYGAIAISVAPYLYRLVWIKLKVDRAVRVAIEIVVPIIVAMLTTVI